MISIAHGYLYKYVRLSHLFVLFYLLISVAIFWQFLKNPGFSLVDDGYSILKGRQILESGNPQQLFSNVYEKDLGRFRPLYLGYFAVVYAIFGANPIGFWFLQTLVVFFTFCLLYLHIKDISKNDFIAFSFPIGWLLLPTVSQNIFRLGTAEPRQALFILISILFLKKAIAIGKLKSIVYSIIFLILAIATKETTVLLLPMYVGSICFVLFGRKNFLRWQSVTVLSLLFVSIFSISVLNMFLKGGYAFNNLSSNGSEIVRVLKEFPISYPMYFVLLTVSFTVFLAKLFLQLWTGQKLFSQYDVKNVFIFYYSLVLFLLVNAIWAFHFERYFYLPWIFIVLIFANEVSVLINCVKGFSIEKLINRKFDIFIILWVSIIVLLTGYYSVLHKSGLSPIKPIKQSLIDYKSSYDSSQLSKSMSELFVNDTQTKYLYVQNDNFEVIYELGLYLSQFQTRNVIIRQPVLELTRLDSRYEYSEFPTQEFMQDNHKDSILVGTFSDTIPTDLPVKSIPFNQKYSSFPVTYGWWIVENK